MPRLLVSALALALLVTPAAAQDTGGTPAPVTWTVTPDLQVQRLGPDVWLHVSWHVLDSGVRSPSNGLLVRDGDGLLLVDTAWGEASTAALLDWAADSLGLPVTRAFSTHWHADRLGGAPVLAARGVPFFAHPRTVAAARAQGLPEPEAIADLAPGEAAAFGPVEVLYPGPGHTADNTVVWLPREEMLVGGCAVKGAEAADLGYTGDADVAAWPDAIRRVQARYPEAAVVVPGHGALGDVGLLAHTLDLLEVPRAD